MTGNTETRNLTYFTCLVFIPLAFACTKGNRAPKSIAVSTANPLDASYIPDKPGDSTNNQSQSTADAKSGATSSSGVSGFYSPYDMNENGASFFAANPFNLSQIGKKDPYFQFSSTGSNILSGDTCNNIPLYIRSLYQNVLNRNPDSSAYSDWVNTAVGVDLNQIADGFVGSLEKEEMMVTQFYWVFLGRGP